MIIDSFKPSGEALGSKALATPKSVDSIAFCPSSPGKIAVTCCGENYQDPRSAYIFDLQSGEKLHDVVTGRNVEYSAIACDKNVLFILWTEYNTYPKCWTIQRFTMEGEFVDTVIDKEALNIMCGNSHSQLPFAVSLEGVVAFATYSGDHGERSHVTLIATNQ